MMGHVIGAPRTVSARISVIFKSEGLECVFVFCGSASGSSSAQNPRPSAPAAPFKNDRRGCEPSSCAMVSTLLSKESQWALVCCCYSVCPRAPERQWGPEPSGGVPIPGYVCVLEVSLNPRGGHTPGTSTARSSYRASPPRRKPAAHPRAGWTPPDDPPRA